AMINTSVNTTGLDMLSGFGGPAAKAAELPPMNSSNRVSCFEFGNLYMFKYYYFWLLSNGISLNSFKVALSALNIHMAITRKKRKNIKKELKPNMSTPDIFSR